MCLKNENKYHYQQLPTKLVWMDLNVVSCLRHRMVPTGFQQPDIERLGAELDRLKLVGSMWLSGIYAVGKNVIRKYNEQWLGSVTG